jgi:hypothetical protein
MGFLNLCWKFNENMIRVHCLLTIGPDRVDTGLNLINSANQQGILIHVLWRENCRPLALDFELATDIETDFNVSLSKARNILLKELLLNGKADDSDVIFLGDDDGSFPPDLAQNIYGSFEDSSLLWALGRYAPSQREINIKRFPNQEKVALGQRESLRMASSLGIYARLSLIKSVGFFDEMLGIGTSIPVGEDTDYVLRLVNASGRARYLPTLLQFHPYKPESKDLVAARIKFLAYLKNKDNAFNYAYIRSIVASLLKRRLTFAEIRYITLSKEPRVGS